MKLERALDVVRNIPGRSMARVFTPTAVATIREMAAEERSIDEIVAEIGTTYHSLISRCWQLGIQLPRRTRRPTLKRARDGRIRAKKYHAKQRILANAMKALLEEQGLSVDEFVENHDASPAI